MPLSSRLSLVPQLPALYTTPPYVPPAALISRKQEDSVPDLARTIERLQGDVGGVILRIECKKQRQLNFCPPDETACWNWCPYGSDSIAMATHAGRLQIA